MATAPVKALPGLGAFDSHTHMDATGIGVDSLLDAARAAGIARVVNVGCDLPSSRWSAETAAAHPEVYAAVAIHPNDLPVPEGGLPCSPDSPEGAGVLAEIERLAGGSRVVAVGETGLDYYWHDTPPQAQREWFRAHIEIARRVGK
ncbi:MAG: TatD family hydrolase, partial [Nocardiopsaceae bacterium]|nr:TatD family hydrolase [Nocardiopsaceae bacterium]